MVKRGASFIVPGTKDHAYVVVNHPLDWGGMAFLLNFTSLKVMTDTTCRIYVGDHPTINKASAVYYSNPMEMHLRDIEHEVGRGNWKQSVDVKEELIVRMFEGAKTSPGLPPDFYHYVGRELPPE